MACVSKSDWARQAQETPRCDTPGTWYRLTLRVCPLLLQLTLGKRITNSPRCSKISWCPGPRLGNKGGNNTDQWRAEEREGRGKVACPCLCVQAAAATPLLSLAAAAEDQARCRLVQQPGWHRLHGVIPGALFALPLPARHASGLHILQQRGARPTCLTQISTGHRAAPAQLPMAGLRRAVPAVETTLEGEASLSWCPLSPP